MLTQDVGSMLRSEPNNLNNDKVQLDVRVGGQWNTPNSYHMWNGELHLDGWMLAGCKFIVKKFCLINKEKALRPSHTYYAIESLI